MFLETIKKHLFGSFVNFPANLLHPQVQVQRLLLPYHLLVWDRTIAEFFA